MRQELYRGCLAALSAVAPLFATRLPAHPLFCHSTMNRFGSLILARFTGDSTAPNSSRWRSAASTSAVVAARKPVPSSTPITNSRGRPLFPFGPARISPVGEAVDRDRESHSHLPLDDPGWMRRRRTRPPATRHRARRAPRPRAPRPRRVRPARSAPAGYGHDQMQRHRFTLGTRGASNGSRCCVPGPSISARASTCAPQSGHLAGNGSRTSMANCVRQPRHSPATV